MKNSSQLLVAAIFLLGACASAGHNQDTDRAQITAAVQALMTAYAANDQDAVMRLVDTRELSFYGSDVSELARSPGELKLLMTADFALWGTAKFGPVSTVDMRIGQDLATAFFNVPFSAGGAPSVTVRVSTVWRRVDGAWLLTQSANTVPTVGSSARDLLKR